MHPGDENAATDRPPVAPQAIPQQRPAADAPPQPVPTHAVPGQHTPGQQPYPVPPGQPPYPVPGQPPYAAPWPQPVPPPRRRWRLALGIGLAVLLVFCVLPAVGAIAFVLLTADEEPQARASSAAPSATRGPARKPVAGDGSEVYRDWMADRVTEALAARDRSLLAGDQAGYLAASGRAKATAVTVLRRQFTSLRALKVGAWHSEVESLSRVSGEGFDTLWQVRVAAHPCFGTAVCEESESVRGEQWQLVGGEPMLLDVSISGKDSKGPRPWEVADLRAVDGGRTLVAASPQYAKSLANLSAQAEKAAQVADRLAFDKRPSKYVIFYASPAEWKSWYTWGPPDWAAGVAIDTGALRTEIVLNAAVVSKSFLDNILRHEFTHSSTIPGRSGDHADWWMVEGIAEYAEMDGSPVRLYASLGLVAKLVSSGGWNGKVDVSAPRDADADDDVGAKYGIGFLAMRQLSERYGEERMLAFFMAVVHENKSEEDASKKIFGKPWSTVEGECAAYIRSVVG